MNGHFSISCVQQKNCWNNFPFNITSSKANENIYNQKTWVELNKKLCCFSCKWLKLFKNFEKLNHIWWKKKHEKPHFMIHLHQNPWFLVGFRKMLWAALIGWPKKNTTAVWTPWFWSVGPWARRQWLRCGGRVFGIQPSGMCVFVYRCYYVKINHT